MEWLEPTPGLEKSILHKIQMIQKRRLFYKLVFDASASFIFFLLGAYSSFSIWQVLSSPTFKGVIALAWGDLPVIVTYWQDFSYSILELLPFTTIFIFGSAIFFLLLFTRVFFINQTLLKKFKLN